MIYKIQSELIREYSANFRISRVDFSCEGFPVASYDFDFLPELSFIDVYTIMTFMGQELSWSWTLRFADLQRMGTDQFVEDYKARTQDLIVKYSLEQLGNIQIMESPSYD